MHKLLVGIPLRTVWPVRNLDLSLLEGLLVPCTWAEVSWVKLRS